MGLILDARSSNPFSFFGFVRVVRRLIDVIHAFARSNEPDSVIQEEEQRSREARLRGC